ncbi:PREDICTED: plakophilin-3 isoform X1 [Poecilia mexicana]|uniref:plakophilin-3 isoform X1 n=1 Tax=Poecilia mexicana TaxID=48701 RepID=UPI00072EB0BD|nr:PREDICTED: plakophilin-3 isoform X1 [Poecilia mexicana]
MSMLTSENAFLSSLQPHTLSTTYALPSDNQLGNGSAMSDDAVRARRVQEQIKMKMAEKSTLPRQNGKASQYAMSDYGGSSTMKYSTYSPSYSSKSSYMYSGSKTLGPRVSTRTDFSSRSAAPDITQFQRMSVGLGRGGGGGGGFYREEMHSGGFQGTIRQNQMDRDDMSVHSLQSPAWVIDNSDAGSMISERDAAYDQQYSQSGMNGFGTQLRQGGSTMTYQTYQTPEPALGTGRRSLSSTLSRGSGLGGGGTEIIQQQSFKGPAHRTINRIANRNRMSMTSMPGSRMTSSSGNIGAGGDRTDGGFLMSVKSGSHGNLLQQRQGGLSRSTSMRSVQSVGGGMDIFGQADLEDNPLFERLHSVDVPTAVSYLRMEDTGMQVLGSAYIQHICFNEEQAKDEVRELHGTELLVTLFKSPDAEVRRFSTGAMRNMIYKNVENKQELIKHGGIGALNDALEQEDDELRKNITGILWNLSAKDGFKEQLKTILPRLTEKVVIPLTTKEAEKAEMIKQDKGIASDCPSEAEILHNTLGYLRNLSSGSEKVRREVREAKGLVESLVGYLRSTLEVGKIEEKGAESVMCTLRNLSFKLFDELPPSIKTNLSEDGTTSSSTVGCFSPNSSKIKQHKACDQKGFSPNEVSKSPKGLEWLWHPKIVHLYNSVIKSCEINALTREAAIGALQNITGGQDPWAEKLSRYMVNDYKMLPNLLDHLRTERKDEQRSLTGLLRNLSSHTDTSQALDAVVRRLPENNKDVPSPEALVNLCGVLNNMVARSFDIAKKLTEGSGLSRLMKMKDLVDDNLVYADASRSARVVLRNMYNYRKLHRIFKRKGYEKRDFCDV